MLLFSNKNRCMEKPMDNLSAQDFCSSCDGNRSPETDTKEAILINRDLLFRLCNLKPYWGWNRNRH